MMLDFIKIFQEKQKQKKEAEKNNAILLDSPVPDFIPYACHYDKDTILTKNGELLQTIKIEGFAYKALGEVQNNMREVIKSFILKNVKDNKFAFYMHTVRREHMLDSNPKFDYKFSQSLHDAWVRVNDWDRKFVNELHITLVHAAMPIKVGYSNFFKMIFIDPVLKEHDQILAKAAEDLTSMADKMLNVLSEYGAVKLGIKHSDTIGYHSEILSFITSIIHLEEKKIPMSIADLSKFLAKYKIAFGNNALEVRRNRDKFFAAILSLKKFDQVSLNAIDKFLQLPIKSVITEAVNFIPKKEALAPYQYQNYIANVSRDEEFREISGLKSLMNNDDQDENMKFFCSSQVTIMIIADELKNLTANMKIVRDKLSDAGIVAVREDINMENCFWSQLPGNFTFITRKNSMLLSNIGGFASLYNFPFGALKSKWGDPITLFNTISGTPYFFNFHVGNNGHTIIVGEEGSGKSTLLSFLLSESLKFNPKTLYLDSDHRSEIFIRSLGGRYKTLSFDKKEENIARFNPLLLEDTEETREFIKYWFIFLLDKYSDPTDLEKYLQAIESAIDVVFALPKEDRKIGNVAQFFNNELFGEINEQIIKQLSVWCGNEEFGHIFDNDTDDLLDSIEDNLFAIDTTSIYDIPMGVSLPILSYILFCFKKYYTSEMPAILVVDNGNRLFNSIYFEKNLAYILKDLEERNAILLTHASFSSEKVNWSSMVGKIYNQAMATKIFLADNSAYENVISIFDFSEEEEMCLHALDVTSRQFMIKQQNSSVIAKMDLSDTNEIKVLACRGSNAKIAKEAIEMQGDDPEKWLPEFYKNAK